jgi:hypothetical protein
VPERNVHLAREGYRLFHELSAEVEPAFIGRRDSAPAERVGEDFSVAELARERDARVLQFDRPPELTLHRGVVPGARQERRSEGRRHLSTVGQQRFHPTVALADWAAHAPKPVKRDRKPVANLCLP